MSDQTTEVEDLNFEHALEELEQIVAKLEGGKGSLDDAITAYQRGAALKNHCQKKLDEARMKVEKIRVPQAGEAATAQPFDS